MKEGRATCNYLYDVVDSPDQGGEVEHHEAAGVIVLGGLDLGQVEALHGTLEEGRRSHVTQTPLLSCMYLGPKPLPLLQTPDPRTTHPSAAKPSPLHQPPKPRPPPRCTPVRGRAG